MVFPASLDARRRRWLHAVAEDLGLAHASVGDVDAGTRRVWLSVHMDAPTAAATAGALPPGRTAELNSDALATDAALCAVLWDHLRASAEHRLHELISDAVSGAVGRESGGWHALAAGECAGEGEGRRLTPQAFAAATLPLLEEEHKAELAAAAEAVEEADAASNAGTKRCAQILVCMLSRARRAMEGVGWLGLPTCVRDGHQLTRTSRALAAPSQHAGAASRACA